MSVSTQLRNWLASGGAPPAPPERAFTKTRLSLDHYGLDKKEVFVSSKDIDSSCQNSDLESQSWRTLKGKEKPLPPSPDSSSQLSVPNLQDSLAGRIRKWKPSKEILYNAILGTSDGMTVPFAVTASLAGVTDSKLVMMAGLAELIGGAVSMAAAGILGARTDVQKYNHLSTRLTHSHAADPTLTTTLITSTLSPFLPPPTVSAIAAHITAQPWDDQLAFLLRFTPIYHDPSPPTTSGVWKIALVLGVCYFSGLVPLLPYMVVKKEQVTLALYISVGVTAAVLAAFGYGKTMMTFDGEVEGRRWECVKGSLECLFVVGVGAGLSVLIIRAVGGTL